MSRNNLMDALMLEAYAATHYDSKKFRPMNPRRIKRAIHLMDRTGWADSETINRITGAAVSSLQHHTKRQKTLNPAKEPKA